MMSPQNISSTPAGGRPEQLLTPEFWVYSFKIALCPLKHSHDWEKCLYAHEGEKLRRRHPSIYQAVQCPEARAKKVCPRGEECPCTHHLFEYWLHPDRYMTCLCELGAGCNRPICLFAHHPSELRPLPDGLTHAPNATGSSRRRAAAAAAASAAAAAAAQAASTPSASSSFSYGLAANAQGSAMGVRQPSTGSLASSTGSYGPDGFAPVAFPSMGGSSPVSIQQQGVLSDAHIRPGFSALDTLSTASPAGRRSPAPGSSPIPSSSLAAGTAALNGSEMLQQPQLPGRAASTGSNTCPSVLVLEAPPPATMSPTQDLARLQAAQQLAQLNLATSGSTAWLSPTAEAGQARSNMSLASSVSSTMGMQGGLGAEMQQLLAGSGNSSGGAAVLLDAQAQQMLRARLVSPRMSPVAGTRAGQQLPSGAFSALVETAGHAQLAAMQAALEESPEHLSFSLWDVNTSAGLGPAASPQAQQLAALAHSGLQVPAPSTLASLEGFSGFGFGRGRPAGSSAPPVSSLASAAADRLLVAQQGGLHAASAATASMGLLTGSLPVGSGSSEAETAKEARLTLLRAWVNAAAAAADGASADGASADGSLLQQEDQLLQAGASVGGRLGRLSGRGLALVAHDLLSVLAPADAVLLVQHLQRTLQGGLHN